MKTVVLIKEIYVQGFRNLGSYLVKNYFKAFTWFTVAMFVMVLYAFLYRLLTGFVFSTI